MVDQVYPPGVVFWKMVYNLRMHAKAVLVVLVLGILGSSAIELMAENDPYIESIESYRAKRLERLRSETGWLTIAGFAWLEEGENSVGTAEGSDVQLPEGTAPASLGILRLETGASPRVVLETNPDVSVHIDDKEITGSIVIWEEGGEARKVSADRGSFWVIPRGDGYAIRMQDPECPLRTGFKGIEFYEIDPAYRVVGTLIDAPDTLDIPNVMGYISRMWCPGPVRFTLNGEDHELFPHLEGDSLFMFVIQDETTGIESYGGGRYIYCDLEPDGTVVIDFNKIYNPPCVFSPYLTCPLPAERDILPLALRVGEKTYQADDH